MCDRKLREPFKTTVDNGYELSVIKVGYDLAKAHENLLEDDTGKGLKHLHTAIYDALQLVPMVIRDTRKEGLIANRVDFGEAFEKLYTAAHGIEQYHARGLADRGYSMVQAAIWAIESAHHMFAVVLSGDPAGMDAKKNANCEREHGINYGYGYRHVTERDFSAWGVGGR